MGGEQQRERRDLEPTGPPDRTYKVSSEKKQDLMGGGAGGGGLPDRTYNVASSS